MVKLSQLKHAGCKIALAALFSLGMTAQSLAAEVTFHGQQQGTGTPLPFSEAVQVDGTLYLSGQLGLDPKTRKLVDGGIRPETKQTMENIKSILAKHGYTMNDVVKCLVMLADIKEWSTFNEEYMPFFTEHFPARSAFAASGLALNARVEVECIAAK